MENLVHKLQRDNPGLHFTTGEACCWSPQHSRIRYAALDTPESIAGLLHEVGHALLGHRIFTSDIDLLKKEVAAWEYAQRLAKEYDATIDDNHIQNCLDTYRDWLFRRSHCPTCAATGVQHTLKRYICINCGANWSVSSARLRRPYRLSNKK